MRTENKLSELAVNGGPKVRTEPWPGPGHLGAEEKAAIDALFDEAIAAGSVIGYNGPAEEAYCKDFVALFGGKGYADGVNSGTSAVYVALRALELEPFTEVISSPITDPGGMMPIVLVNCIPAVADAVPGGFNTGPEQIEQLISPLTSAILVAHIAGEPVDMEGIMAVARKHGIPVVEDCAQAHGAKLNGKLVGLFGDIAAFSTMFGKHYCTGGQGGLVYTRNEKLYIAARQIADRGKPFGLPEGSTNCVASLNLNLDEIGAAIGRVQLKKMPEIVQRRREVVAGIAEGIGQFETVSMPPILPGAEPSYWFVRLRFHPQKAACDKETYCKALIAEGMPINPRYDAMPHTLDWYQKRKVFGTGGLPWTSSLYKGDPNRQFHCPNAQAAIDSHFNLGAHQGWGDREVADTIAAFKKVEAAYAK